jgi:hypothetical protein
MEDPRRTRWFPVVVKSVLRTSGFVCEGRRWPIYVYRFYVHLTFTPLPLAGRILLIHLKNTCHGVFASLICRNTDGTPRAFAASTHLQSRRVNSSGLGFQLRISVRRCFFDQGVHQEPLRVGRNHTTAPALLSRFLVTREPSVPNIEPRIAAFPRFGNHTHLAQAVGGLLTQPQRRAMRL